MSNWKKIASKVKENLEEKYRWKLKEKELGLKYLEKLDFNKI